MIKKGDNIANGEVEAVLTLTARCAWYYHAYLGKGCCAPVPSPAVARHWH